jgi:MFS family permease
MASFGAALAAGFKIESETNNVSAPSSAKIHHQRGPSIEELDAIELPDYGKLNKNSDRKGAIDTTLEQTSTRWTPRTHHTPSGLEASEPPTPTQVDVSRIVPSFFDPPMNKYRVLAACLIYFGNGMNDSAPGALLPYIEAYYNIGYAVVSLIWITNAVGFILAAFFTDMILSRLGRARLLMLSELLMIAGYVMAACAPPFPAVVVSYLINGFGYAMNLALNNVFCANLANSTVVLGLAHGSYGLGGILGPIVATALVSNGVLWSRFYLIVIGVRTLCFFAGGWSFWNYEKEGSAQFANSLQQIASRQSASEPSKLRLLWRALKNRTTLIGAAFIFAYQGAEVAESGWFISYLIKYRHGDPKKVGYVTAGFWVSCSWAAPMTETRADLERIDRPASLWADSS